MTDAGGGQWRFMPDAVTASPGDTVRYVLDDVIPHNVEFKDVPPGTELGAAAMGPFLLRKGETYDVAIDGRFAPGRHRFVCTPHEIMGMVGTLEVLPFTDTTQPR
jgi:plastocyanin